MSDHAPYWVDAGPVGEFPAGEVSGRTLHGKPLAIVPRTDGFFVTDDVCPHRGAPFAGSGRVDEDDGTLVCGWHYWAFSMDTGQQTFLPNVCLKRYPTRVVDGRLEVDVALPDPEPPLTMP